MTKFQYTPGPWIAHKYPTKHGYAYSIRHKMLSGISIANLSPGITSDRIEPICEANAHLIAAAPDLLAALLPLVEASPVGGGMIRFDGDELAAARAAIAKAKGA